MKKILFVFLVCLICCLSRYNAVLANDYYVYGTWDWNGESAQDVNGIDGYGDYLVVEDGAYFYFKKVTVLDSDNDGIADPYQHPDNPDDPGPVETRVFTDVGSYYYYDDIGSYIGSSYGGAVMTAEKLYLGGDGELYAWNWSVDENGNIVLSDFVAILTDPQALTYFEDIAYDENTNTFYALTRERDIYSFNPDEDNDWNYEFSYSGYSGWHGDGIASVNGHLYISDMTSDVIGQWDYINGQWQETATFLYSNPYDVEGMGFGPNNHFWVTAWSGVFYEIGGGKLQESIENPIPEPATVILVGSSLLGIAFIARKNIGKNKINVN